MRKEVQSWLDPAADDFDGAEFNCHGQKDYIAAFLCQQAVEKAWQSYSLIYLDRSFHEVYFLFPVGWN